MYHKEFYQEIINLLKEKAEEAYSVGDDDDFADGIKHAYLVVEDYIKSKESEMIIYNPEKFEKENLGNIVEKENNVVFYPGSEPLYDDDYDDPGYPDLNLGDRRLEVIGSLRDMVIRKVGVSDDSIVEIIESHQNGGYCGTCAFEYLVFEIIVNGDTVYRSAFEDNPFQVLQEWLTEEGYENAV